MATATGIPFAARIARNRSSPASGARRPRDSARYSDSFSSETATQLLARQLAAQQVREDVGVALAVEARALGLVQRGQAAAGHELGKGLGVQRHVVHQRPVEVEHHGPRLHAARAGTARATRPTRVSAAATSSVSDGVEDDRAPLARAGLEDQQQAQHAHAGGGAAQEAEDLGGGIGAVAELARRRRRAWPAGGTGPRAARGAPASSRSKSALAKKTAHDGGNDDRGRSSRGSSAPTNAP